MPKHTSSNCARAVGVCCASAACTVWSTQPSQTNGTLWVKRDWAQCGWHSVPQFSLSLSTHDAKAYLLCLNEMALTSVVTDSSCHS